MSINATSDQIASDIVCRICLNGKSQGKLIEPCQCQGSLKYTHLQCMIQWITSKQDQLFNTCEICNKRYKFQVDKALTCSDCRSFGLYFWQMSKINMFIFVIVSCVLVYLVIDLSLNFDKKQGFTLAIQFSGITIYVLILVRVIYLASTKDKIILTNYISG